MKAGATGIIAIVLTATLVAQTGPGRGPQSSEAVQVQRVRVAIGHGNVPEARRLAEAIPAGAGRELGSALVDIFEGKDDAARARLEPLANVNRTGDAALELGLLELRRGQRRQGEARLEPIVSNRAFAGPDDYFRLARAARAAREFLLANDAYNEIAKAKLPRPDIYAERGDVFYQRHAPGDAVIEYRTALEADPAWVPALIGLSRALAHENPKAASQAGAEAEKLAPNHPDLWLLKAEHRLDQEDLPGALEALDRVAQSRPGTVEESAFRAAVAFAQGDTAAMNASIERANTTDPTSALAYRRVGERAADMFRSAEATEWARKATVKDPDDGFAFFDLGLYQIRSGDEPGARKALERSWELDKSGRVTKNLLDVLDRIDTFETVAAGDYIFKFEKADAAVLRTYAIPLAEEASKTFGARYGFKPEGPILVEVFSVHDEFAIRTMGLPGLEGALGACFGKVVAMDSPRARPPGQFSWQATLWHELAHVYTLQLSNYRVPRWLTEGISVYEEYKRNPAWGRELALEFAVQLAEGETFGVKKLPDAFKRPETLALAYFEASLLTEHLVELNGEAGLRTLLAAYAAGDKDPAAFAKAFGRSVDAVEASFKTFVDQKYGALARAMAPPKGPMPDDMPALRALAAQSPGSFQVQMALAVALYKTGDTAGAKVPLEKAAELAPQASGPGSPRALLAGIAEKEGDNTRARRELRRLLAFDHENVAAARKLADLSGDAPANADDRDFALRLVADLDPFDADTHVNLGRRLLAKNTLQPALVEFQAALALGPSNLAEAHTDVGETLFKIGRKDEARRHVLLALQQAPTYARAQDILLAILGGTDVKRLLLFTVTATLLLVGASPAFADGKRYAVIVQGASGDPQYATLHRGWVDSLVTLLRSQFKIDGPALSILVETPKDGELRSTAESVRTVLGRLAKDTKADDLVFVMLIGHGSGDAAAAKFNLIGPDMTAEEWSAALKPVPARIAFVDSTSSSFPFLAGLAGPNRIVITATSTFGQKYHTVFPDAFIRAMTASEADADKNGRISVMEAFTYASRLVAQHYEQAGTMSTERASIDDTGDGKGRDAATTGDDGNVAAFTYLAAATIPTVSDPEVQQLFVRQQALTEQVDDLRRRKAMMGAADFDSEFEKLIVDLALVSRDIRRKTGK